MKIIDLALKACIFLLLLGIAVAFFIFSAPRTANAEPLKGSITDAPLTATDFLCMGEYKITGYDPYCTHCCGKCDGITASGAIATPGKTIAIKGFKFGTQIYIVGLGLFMVEDRGVKAGVIDVACGSHEECYAITGNYKVYLIS